LMSYGIHLKSQTFQFVNSLCADVVVGYELGDIGCNVCDWGTIPLQANGGTFNLPPCGTGVFNGRLCIWLISMDGVAMGSGNDCHNDVYWISFSNNTASCCMQVCNNGTVPTGACSGGTLYNIAINGLNWQVQ